MTELDLKIKSILSDQTFVNVRVSILLLPVTMTGYYLLIMFDAGLWDFIGPGSRLAVADVFSNTSIWRYFQQYLVMISLFLFGIVYVFFGEHWIEDVARRVLALNLVIFGICLGIGIFFVYQVPGLKNPTIANIIWAVMGSLGGLAVMVFSTDKRTYLYFVAAFVGPLVGFLFFFSSEIPHKILGGLGVMLAVTGGILTRIDYHRRVRLIETEHKLEHEKHSVLLASEQLRESLELVKKLKMQQDGDYYLTSLLLKPLAVNSVRRPSNVQVDSLVHQKKQFSFKDREHKIGGDLNIAHTLTLSGGDCTVFLNADAMGKSMQGASGALVLGAVFQSVIARTKMKPETRDMYPERWLAYTFLELQAVFESFDCSMLVSLILAVIENNTGMLYYINAEHPLAVLLRDGKARFLDGKSYYHKLGTPGNHENIMVDAIQLQENDVLILGSDGRDDVVTSPVDATQRVINEDENLFVQRVEAAGGDIQHIYELTKSAGELSDDFSLLRVGISQIPNRYPDRNLEKRRVVELFKKIKTAYQTGRHDEARLLMPSLLGDQEIHPAITNLLVKIALNMKAYDLACHFADELLQIASGKSESLLLASIAHNKAGHLERAADLGERLRLRNPSHFRNLINLVDIYVSLKSGRASKLLAELKKKAPEHPGISQWLVGILPQIAQLGDLTAPKSRMTA
jgi:tetratricopeptide (TPR) repeat protein